MPELTDSSARHLLNAPPTRRLVTGGASTYKYDEIEGFLRLPSHRRKDEKDDQSYRSIEPARRPDDSEESDTSEGEGESSEGDETDTFIPMGSLQATLKSLEEHLSKDPSSIPTWLSLLSHTLSTVPPTSKNASKARSDITLSLLSRALSAHPDNKRSWALRLKYLKAGEEEWSEGKLKVEWEDALRGCGGGRDAMEMWMEWLDWRIRRGENGVEGVVEDAGRVLKALGNSPDSEVGRLRVFWRVAVAFRDAGLSLFLCFLFLSIYIHTYCVFHELTFLQCVGYVERATALFQAQAEL